MMAALSALREVWTTWRVRTLPTMFGATIRRGRSSPEQRDGVRDDEVPEGAGDCQEA